MLKTKTTSRNIGFYIQYKSGRSEALTIAARDRSNIEKDLQRMMQDGLVTAFRTTTAI